MVGSGCTESRATCINPTDCDCSDCANSFKCGAPWKTADSNYLYTYEYKTGSGCTEGKSTAATERTNVVKRMDNNRGSCVQNLVPGEGAYWTRYMCSAESGGTVTATRCSDDECQVCTGDDVVYDVVKVLANSQGVCIENKATDKAFMMTPPHNDMNFEDAIAPCLRNEAIPTPAPVPVAPTPSPARTCKECVALDNMEWCWDPPTGFGKDVLGERDDVGYCLKPGDGCHQSRATVRSSPLVCRLGASLLFATHRPPSASHSQPPPCCPPYP